MDKELTKDELREWVKDELESSKRGIKAYPYSIQKQTCARSVQVLSQLLALIDASEAVFICCGCGQLLNQDALEKYDKGFCHTVTETEEGLDGEAYPVPVPCGPIEPYKPEPKPELVKSYDGEAGAYYFKFSQKEISRTTEEVIGFVNVDWDANGQVVGIEILGQYEPKPDVEPEREGEDD
jgi:uncharacterized protein YuzE